jgi:protein involved in polysaccharide export with SLBB domain
MSDVSYEATYVSPLENKIIVEDYRNMVFNSSKYNTVSFKSKTNDLISVTIAGSIEFPGTYSLNSNATLEDLYKIIGDFKDTAFFEGIIFKRELVRDRQIKALNQAKESLNESILVNMQNNEGASINPDLLTALATDIDPEDLGRIAGDFSPISENTQNIILYDGDSIFIPIKSNSISVLGEVLNPNNFLYENRLSVREAVEYAGGYKEFAEQKGIYIIRANGLVTKAGRNVFGSNKFLEAGDTVIVPRKLILDNPISQTIAPITQILSDLAFSAAAIDNLSSN